MNHGISRQARGQKLALSATFIDKRIKSGETVRYGNSPILSIAFSFIILFYFTLHQSLG